MIHGHVLEWDIQIEQIKIILWKSHSLKLTEQRSVIFLITEC